MDISVTHPPSGDRSRGGLSFDGKFTYPRGPQERRACIRDRIHVLCPFCSYPNGVNHPS